MSIDRAVIRVKAMLVAQGEDGRAHAVARCTPTAENPDGYDRLIGGSVEVGESHREAIVREELGAEIHGLRLLGCVENRFRYEGEAGHEIVFVYAGRLDPQPSEVDAVLTESDGTVVPVVWRPVEDAEERLPLYPAEAVPLVRTVATRSTLEVGGSRFTITRATEEDVPALVALLADDPLGSQRETDDPAAYLRAFAAIDADPAQLLVAVRDEEQQVVGTLQLSFVPGLARQGATRMLVEAVRLAASTRGKGLGTALFGWAHDHGRARGASIVQLTTDKTRVDAHRFYVALGYVATHEGFKRAL